MRYETWFTRAPIKDPDYVSSCDVVDSSLVHEPEVFETWSGCHALYKIVARKAGSYEIIGSFFERCLNSPSYDGAYCHIHAKKFSKEYQRRYEIAFPLGISDLFGFHNTKRLERGDDTWRRIPKSARAPNLDFYENIGAAAWRVKCTSHKDLRFEFGFLGKSMRRLYRYG